MTEPYMEPDEPSGYDEDTGPRWWSRDALLEPRAGSLLAFTLAVISLLSISPAQVITFVALNHNLPNLRWYAVTPGISGLVAFVAAGVAVWVVARSWEQEADWSGALARAALGVAGISIVLNVAAFAVAVATGRSGPSFSP